MNHKQADYEIDLFERLIQRLPEILNQGDLELATQIEEEFGVNKTKILEQFNSPNAGDYTTAELIMRAYSPGFSFYG